MSTGERLRIGDAEREQAQTVLGDHYAAGRLDHDEYSERLDRIWAARTHPDLDRLFVDLPGGSGTPARAPSSQYPYSTPAARRPAAASRRPAPRLPAGLIVLLVVVGLVLAAANLPLILVGLGVWFFVLRGGCGAGRWHVRRW